MAIRKPVVRRAALSEPEPREATAEEWRELFDADCRAELGIGREEFLCRFDAGEFTDSEAPDMRWIFMHYPFDSVR